MSGGLLVLLRRIWVLLVSLWVTRYCVELWMSRMGRLVDRLGG